MRFNEPLPIKLYKYTSGTFELQAIIDDYEQISFEHNLYNAGNFTITINYNIPNAKLFERGLFVQFGSSPYDFGEITTIANSIGADGKGSEHLNITGFDARYIFKRRVIKNLNNNDTWSMTAKGEYAMRSLIYDQCGLGAEEKRRLPVTNTIPTEANALGDIYSVSESYSNLYDVLCTIATQSDLGWAVLFDGSALSLYFYSGHNYSDSVFFSTDFESLANGNFTDTTDAFANSIYIGGKGSGSERDIYEGENYKGRAFLLADNDSFIMTENNERILVDAGTAPEGLDRYEAFDNQSSMTTESEYEAEAEAMLTQYGQTITMSGAGFAKCPFIFREQYDIGDIVKLSFSGKSANVQILSVTENWTKGAYGLQFSFGKPINNINQQLQIMLRKIQEASSKTVSTSSIHWYTIPTDTQMPKADVTFDTIGFKGTTGTFKLYLDNEKTGAKTYHVYIKQTTGNITLTTGVTGASNLTLSSGTYVSIIYVDSDGNIYKTV